MNQKQVEALIYLSRNGNFIRAAEMLYFDSQEDDYITPETLQYRIKKLEDELGVQLYHRAPGKSVINLTREGQLCVREALIVYDCFENLKTMFSESKKNELIFAATELVILHRLVDPITKFLKSNPKAKLEVRSAGPVDIEKQVLNGQIDFGFATHSPSDNEKDLEYFLWKKSNFVALTPKDHPLAKMKSVSLEQLADHPLILLTHDLSQRDDRAAIDMAFRRQKLTNKRNIIMETTNSEIISCYVEAGIGVGITADTVLNHSHRKLAKLEIEPSMGTSEVGVLLRKGKLITKIMKAFFAELDGGILHEIEGKKM